MNLVASEQCGAVDELRLDNPLFNYLGVNLASWEVGRCEFELAIAAYHSNRQSSLQGGMTAALLDAACGYAGLFTDAEPGDAATVMSTISCLDKLVSGKIRGVGQVKRSGRSLYFPTGELLAEDGRLAEASEGGSQVAASRKIAAIRFQHHRPLSRQASQIRRCRVR